MREALDAQRQAGHDLLPESEVAEQSALLAERDLGAEVELAGLADVVDDRGSDEQVGVEARVQHARVLRERGHRHRVLEQAAEVGVVAAARAGRAAQPSPERPVRHERGEQAPVVRVVHLAREVLQEAVELVEVAVGAG